MRDVNAGGRAKRHRMSAGQRRESILKAATEVFTTAGYRAGKVSDVAARVGVTEPVIFQNFGSKAALFAAVLDRVAEDLRAELDTLVKRHGSATELLAHVLNAPHTHRPRVPAEPGPRLPAEPESRLPGGQVPRLPTEPGPRLPGGQDPRVPAEPGPRLPAEPESRLPGGQVPRLPTEPGPRLPGGQDPRVPAEPESRQPGGQVPHLTGGQGSLFADAISLTAESEDSEPGRRILGTLAGHLTDLFRRGQDDGDIRSDLDAEAGAWLVLSILAARPLRAAMPDRDRLDTGVTALVLQTVTQPRPGSEPG